MRVNVNVMRLMIGLILRVRMPILKGTVTCQNSQKGVGNDRLQFTANNKGAVQTLKPSLACVQTSPLPQEKSGEETSVNRRC